MGACGSRLKEGCLHLRSSSSPGSTKMKTKKMKSNKNKNDGNAAQSTISTRIKGRDRRIRRRFSAIRNTDNNHITNNPAFLGSLDAGWADAVSVLDSECDDFYSVPDDGFSFVGSESVSGVTRDGQVTAVYVDEVSNGVGDDETQLTTNTCLPCLAPSPVSASKRPSNPGTPNSRKKATIRLSFKRRDESHLTPTLLSPKVSMRRLIAGATVPYCPVDKKMPDCWSSIEPSSFKVRGQNYFKDKKKDYASNCAAFYPFGVDVFLCPRKIQHIAQFLEFPVVSTSDEAPSILVVNVQIPLYPAAIFQSENDGEGLSLVMYFKLSERYSKELPSQLRENFTRLIDDEVERVKSFPVDTIVPFRERLKILGRLVNVDDLQLTATEKKLINTYNEKPVLSRPQHEFYLGENYFEVDLDMHRFSYVSRKGMQALQDRLKLCVLDFGLTIQGNKTEDMPEHILCCIRLNEIDYTKYHQLVC